MLLRAGDAGIHRVDVEVMPRDHVARGQRALVEMDVIAIVDNAPRVIEVDKQRLAVGPGFGLDDMHGRTRRSEIDLVARGLHVMLRVAAVKHEVPGAARQGILDERAGNAQAAIVVDEAAARRHCLDAGRDGLGKADSLQQLQGGFMDPLHVAVGQRLVLSALHAGTDSGLRHRDWPGAHGAAGFASAAAAGKVFDSTHAEYSSVARISSVSGRGLQRPNFCIVW